MKRTKLSSKIGAPMPAALRATLLEVKLRSKRGQPITSQEATQCRRAIEKWPLDYRGIDHEVQEITMREMNPLYR